MIEGINEDIAAALLISLHSGNFKNPKQHDIIANIYFETIFPATKIHSFIST